MSVRSEGAVRRMGTNLSHLVNVYHRAISYCLILNAFHKWLHILSSHEFFLHWQSKRIIFHVNWVHTTEICTTERL